MKKKAEGSLLDVGGHELHMTNIDKVFWPKEGYKKGDLLLYHHEIAPYMLPYLKNRPIMLHRFPGGVGEEGFYQKDMAREHLPDWVETFPIQHEERLVNYLLIPDEATLLFAINLGSVDLHPFHSQIKDPEHPDYIVLDFDPKEIDFRHVVEAARLTHEILEDWGIESFCKTSGGRGLHIYIPLQQHFTYDEAKIIAETVALTVHQQLPNTTTVERKADKKRGKVFLDFLRNNWTQTVVAPYTVRPREGATVSTPLDWKEVTTKLNPQKFTIKTLPGRLKEVGDLFKPVLGKAKVRELKKIIRGG
ncbi:MAG: hypothetical protein H0X51_03345 [Parachlamydiaceae bacterium]|nr:hypothetical protein [Parachlamydiaceae bacterium]